MSVIPPRATKALPVVEFHLALKIIRGRHTPLQHRYWYAILAVWRPWRWRYFYVAFHRLIAALVTNAKIAGVTKPTGVNANVQLGLLPRVADVGSAFRTFA
jgi:hypothetical protein